MSIYAKHTTVPVDRSRAQVERVLTRYGATGFGYSWEKRQEAISPAPMHGPKVEEREVAFLMFEVKKRRVRLDVPMPTLREAKIQVRLEGAKP